MERKQEGREMNEERKGSMETEFRIAFVHPTKALFKSYLGGNTALLLFHCYQLYLDLVVHEGSGHHQGCNYHVATLWKQGAESVNHTPIPCL